MRSLTLAWTAVGDEYTIGSASEYDVRYSTSDSTPFEQMVQIEGEPRPKSAWRAESLVVAELIPGTGYCFRIRVADDAPNWSEISSAACGRTAAPDTTPPETILDVRIEGTEERSIVLRWTAPGGGGSARAAEYDLRFAGSSDTHWDAMTPATGEPIPGERGADESFTLGGLLPASEYCVRIRSRDAEGNLSELSNEACARTLDVDLPPPSRIDDLRVIAVAETFLTIAWTAPGVDGNIGAAEAYAVRFTTGSLTEENWDLATELDTPPIPASAGTPETTIVRGLTPGTDFELAVRARDERGQWSPLSNIARARTTSSAWTPMLSSLDGPRGFASITTLATFRGDLVMGGSFSSIDNVAFSNIALWRDRSWLSPGSGVTGNNAWVFALVELEDEIIVGGRFNEAGGEPADSIAAWDGVAWSSLGTNLPDWVSALAVLDGTLIAAHGHQYIRNGQYFFRADISRWDGQSWISLDAAPDQPVSALHVHDGALVAIGSFTAIGGVAASGIALWNGADWSAISPGVEARGATAATTYDGDLVVGGFFATWGGVPLNGLARWDGASWQPIGRGVTLAPGASGSAGVSTLVIHDGELIVGGRFDRAGETPAQNIARWDGTTWRSLGTGVAGIGRTASVRALASTDDGVVAAGVFDRAGAVPARAVARWKNPETRP